MIERELITRMLGDQKPSVLMTDGYKFAMAQAGFPLREETFYLSFRRPGWYFIPFDLEALILELCPSETTPTEKQYLETNGYALNTAMSAALQAKPKIHAAPQGSWIYGREPILTVTAPSFLTSWLEPLAIWLQYPIQVASAALLEGKRSFVCSCDDEAAITRLTLQAAGINDAEIRVDAAGYQQRVRQNAKALIQSLDGDSHRLFEVGMRGATCMQMHALALSTLAGLEIKQTSNVYLAQKLGLTPVGTTGHEHQERWDNDVNAFRANRDMRPQAPSYLFDTYDTEQIGIPAALQVIRESPERACSVRFDSGDQLHQLQLFLDAGVTPTFVFMDSINPQKAALLEDYCKRHGVPAKRRLYGAGGFLVGKAAATDLQRDRVAAVYKLSQSGELPVMKFSTPSKSTLPGRPCIFRRRGSIGPAGLIGQQGEMPPKGYELLKNEGFAGYPQNYQKIESIGLSAATQALVKELRHQKIDAVKASLSAQDNSKLKKVA
ncbi:nicotinate phosphoribosyltransferase [Myxococcota bacterium]|nr:nicotinate phosphoribosyltransferase [Myxococcota bacterium]